MSFITAFGTPFVIWLIIGIAFVVGGILLAELGSRRTRTHGGTNGPGNIEGPDAGGTK